MATTKVTVKLGSGGRIVIPSDFRKTLGIADGDEVVLSLDQDGLNLMSVRQSVRRAQRLVKRYVKGKRSLSTELLQDRRKEASRE
ncbi:MAG: AbrB/MazE/SpoVT family DNA-binding domain-containing protein [Vicinamibacteria bacterium]